MACANKTCLATTIDPVSTSLAKSRHPRGFSLSYWITLTIWCCERRQQREALLELDDRMLADVGITKSQAVEETKKPFWK
jgi:uncharacterized protein YjiS (DUF1127 family)